MKKYGILFSMICSIAHCSEKDSIRYSMANFYFDQAIIDAKTAMDDMLLGRNLMLIVLIHTLVDIKYAIRNLVKAGECSANIEVGTIENALFDAHMKRLYNARRLRETALEEGEKIARGLDDLINGEVYAQRAIAQQLILEQQAQK